MLCAKNVNIKKSRLKESMPHIMDIRFPFKRVFSYLSVAPCSCEKFVLAGSSYAVVNVRSQQHYSFVRKPQKPGKALSHTSLINSLQKCNSLTEQIEVFRSAVKLTDEDIISRHIVCQDVEKILKPYFPSCFVYLGGSSINGFGLKGCDVDLSLQFSNGQNNEMSSFHNASLLENIPQVNDSLDEFYKSQPKNQLLVIKKILKSLNFEEITVIPGRCPIVSFHIHNLSCDLSINNSLALQATSLMTLCGKLDKRVPPLMQIIKYWATRSKLIGPGSKFKSYALFLLVIYFLQTRNPPVLPKVEKMFENSDFLNNLENWSYDIKKYLDSFEMSSNCQTIDELLREFFFFYADFDFTYVICPISGNVIDKEKLAMQTNFDSKASICVQDPVNLSWNVTSGTNWKNCVKFFNAIISVCEKYQKSSFFMPGIQNWGLSLVFNSESSHDNIKEFSLDIPVVLKNMNSIHSGSDCSLKKAASHLKYILSHCLLFPCKQMNSYDDIDSLEFPQNVKSLIVNKLLNDDSFTAKEKSTLNTDNFKENRYFHSVKFICATKNTWSHRNTFTFAFTEAKNVFDKEHLISKYMEEAYKNIEKKPFYFWCEFYALKLENNISLSIKFKPLNNDRFNPLLVIFFKEYIPWLMNELFDSHSE